MSTEKIETVNRTQEAVTKQIAAMAAGVFEVGVFDPESERMILRTWNKEVIIKSIPWLRFENLQGRNIYVRPAGPHSLSLVDDLTADAIQSMKGRGFTPALVVETSPRNFQVWLQHGRTLDKALSTAVAKALARQFHGDLGSADWRHFGRLAGFTNRKEKHLKADGLFPYVRVVEAGGLSYQKATNFIQNVQETVKSEIHPLESVRSMLKKELKHAASHPEVKGIAYFRDNPKYGGAQSRSDMAYAVYALAREIPDNTIRDAIASQGLSFKGSHARQQEYIARIINKARTFLGG